MFVTTPSRITADVRRLCRRLGSVSEPVFVDVSASRATSQEDFDDCFHDVQREVEKSGGNIQYGWTIWEWPGIFIEAEFHAVWRRTDGELLDVTPKKDGEERILFVPDLVRVFSGKQIDNVRVAIGRDPRIKQLLRLQEDIHRRIRRQMQGISFRTQFEVEPETALLMKRAAGLELELTQSRDARRAAQCT